MRHWCLYTSLFLVMVVYAQPVTHTSLQGVDTVKADFFRTFYHRSDMVYYMEALNDHTIQELPCFGQWWIPEPLSIAVEGLPCIYNRYYVDGFRVDDHFQPGSMQYIMNMQHYDLHLETHTAQWRLERDTAAPDYVEVNYNLGQIGNGKPGVGTNAIFNIKHESPTQAANRFKEITARRHLKGLGTLDAAYTIRDKQGRAYRQHVYAAYGQRAITKQNQLGLVTEDPFYNASFYKVQADGVLWRDKQTKYQLAYRLNIAGRTDGGSEYLYNEQEVYDHKNYTGSIYFKHALVTTGLTWATNVVKHDSLSFSRNLLDIDGESFEPWVPDGKTHELSWALNYRQKVLPWLSVYVDGYNSLELFRPSRSTFSNEVYMLSPVATEPTPLYQYQWHTNAFVGGLLENTAGLDFHWSLCRPLDLKAHIDVTLDAILLKNKCKVSPNVQAGFNLALHPCSWFEMGLSLDYLRLPYTMTHLRFFSDDYLNGEIYYAGTKTLKGLTGGQRHHYQENLRQTTYLNFDLPIHFRIRDKRGGLHEVVLQQSYKKYFNTWFTQYTNGVEGDDYTVTYTPSFGTNWLFNSPYYVSQLTRYTYTGRKVMLSLGWQSLQSAGYAALGNGVTANWNGVLSESTANPKTQSVVKNEKGTYPGVSRVDLDKGYVFRFYIAYNICRWVQTGLTVKWTDGKPFTAYQYEVKGQDVEIRPLSSRGTNPTDGNFGTRNCAKFIFDLHVQAQWKVREVPMRLMVECYNLWDFCTDLAELAFAQDVPNASRASVIMDIPTGLKATLSIDL